MSPLARTRQLVAGTLFLISFAVAAEPVATPPVPASPQPAAQPIVLAPKGTAQIAHSALLVVQGTATEDSLQLKIQRAGNGTAIDSDDVTVTVDGKTETVARENTGVYTVPINDLRGDGSREAAKDVDIVVAHDGIREILSSKLGVAEAPAGGGLLGDHKQFAWWILNIAIVLIAGIAITRRKS
jgi:hypothetical protein